MRLNFLILSVAKVRDYIELCKQNVAKFIFNEINRVFACFFIGQERKFYILWRKFSLWENRLASQVKCASHRQARF